MTLLQEIDDHYRKGLALEKEARQSKATVQYALDAAKEFLAASQLSAKAANDTALPAEKRAICSVLHLYYQAAYNKSASWYHYETKNFPEARTFAGEQGQAIASAIMTAKEHVAKVSEQQKAFLQKMIEQWQGEELALAVQVASINARDAWENDRTIDSLDYYRQTIGAGEQALQYFQTHMTDLPSIRVMQGNIFAMMANAAQVQAKLIFDEAKRKRVPMSELPMRRLRDLMQALLRTLDIGNQAVIANPEWLQYRDAADQARDNIEHLLRDNLSRWLDIYLAFEDNQELRTIMRTTDIRKYKEVEAIRKIEVNSVGQLWAKGSFFLLVFLTTVVTVYLFATMGFKIALLAVLGIPIIFLVVSAVMLRTIGELSEAGFIETLRIALKFQLTGLSRLIDQIRRTSSDNPEQE
ncbi:MAG: hypothetical protein ABFD92_11970 [Planctomycetaceae bacterium]|nr:hypothetical protein [Planctomycetaceae bacterium]